MQYSLDYLKKNCINKKAKVIGWGCYYDFLFSNTPNIVKVPPIEVSLYYDSNSFWQNHTSVRIDVVDPKIVIEHDDLLTFAWLKIFDNKEECIKVYNDLIWNCALVTLDEIKKIQCIFDKQVSNFIGTDFVAEKLRRA
jgi:hypothetical protein